MYVELDKLRWRPNIIGRGDHDRYIIMLYHNITCVCVCIYFFKYKHWRYLGVRFLDVTTHMFIIITILLYEFFFLFILDKFENKT